MWRYFAFIASTHVDNIVVSMKFFRVAEIKRSAALLKIARTFAVARNPRALGDDTETPAPIHGGRRLA